MCGGGGGLVSAVALKYKRKKKIKKGNGRESLRISKSNNDDGDERHILSSTTHITKNKGTIDLLEKLTGNEIAAMLLVVIYFESKQRKY